MTDTVADLVFRGGHVHTVDPRRPRADAVAVEAGRIVAVGDDAEIKPWISPRTRVVDLRGGLLVPGFQDAHVHPLHGGIGRLRCDSLRRVWPGATKPFAKPRGGFHV